MKFIFFVNMTYRRIPSYRIHVTGFKFLKHNRISYLYALKALLVPVPRLADSHDQISSIEITWYNPKCKRRCSATDEKQSQNLSKFGSKLT